MNHGEHIDLLDKFTLPQRTSFKGKPEDNPHLSSSPEFRDTVSRLLTAEANLYHISEIDKGNGKKRIIEAPSNSQDLPLRQVQKLIHRALSPLDNGVSSHAFRAGTSAYSGLVQMGNHMSSPNNPHGIRSMYSLDVKNFFPSIDESMIRKELEIMLNRLLVKYPHGPNISRENLSKLIDIIIMLCTYEGRLPQGAPSSPTIANIVANRIDGRVRRALEDTMGLKETSIYGRYADDMVILSGTHLSQSQRKTIRQIVQDFGLHLAHEKSLYEEGKGSYTLWGVEMINGKTQENMPNITFRISPERDREYAAKILDLSQKLTSGTITYPHERASLISQVIGILGFSFHISVLGDGDRIIRKIQDGKKGYFLSDRCEHAWRIFLANHQDLMHPNCRNWFTEKDYIDKPHSYENFREGLINRGNGGRFRFEGFDETKID